MKPLAANVLDPQASSNTQVYLKTTRRYSKRGTTAHTCNASTWDAEASGLGGQGHLWLPIKLEASLDYVRPHFRKTKTNKQKYSN